MPTENGVDSFFFRGRAKVVEEEALLTRLFVLRVAAVLFLGEDKAPCPTPFHVEAGQLPRTSALLAAFKGSFCFALPAGSWNLGFFRIKG